jgi:PAS domain S-box-containing protein
MTITKSNINKLLLTLVVLTLSLLIALGGLSFYLTERKIIRNEKHNELRAIANLKANQLVNWHKERISEALFFTQNEPYITYVKGIIDGNNVHKLLQNAPLEHISTNKRYENIFILDENGRLCFTLDIGFDLVDEVTVRQAAKVFKTKQVFFSDFYYCPYHDVVHYDVFAPVLDGHKAIAVMVFRIDPADYIYPLLQDWPTPSETAETLIVRQEGDSVVFLNQLRHYFNKDLSLRISMKNDQTPAVKAALGFEGVFEGVDYRGHKVLSDISIVPETNWYLIAKVDIDEIYAELYQRAVFIAIIVTAIILLVVIAMIWFYHYRQRNIYRELYQKKTELHESQELFRATLYSIGDGVITTDKKGLVKQINPVAEKLTGWNEAQARGKQLDEVFRIINEDTRESVENSAAKVLKEGIIVGLANHTLLISKNGEEIPIADSGAPIKDKGGNIIGVVMVFRDQSEERAYINSLEESEARFRTIFEIASLGIAQVDPANGKIITVNNYFEVITGYGVDELLKMTFIELTHPDDRETDWEIFSKAARGEIEYRNEKRYVRKDGTSVWVRLHVAFIRDDKGKPIRTVAICEDITERKKAEEDLKRIEWMLQPPKVKEPLEDFVPVYGDLTNLNRNGLIFNSIDQETLKIFSADYLSLLETSSAIYDKNGDYALGIFSSGWCRFLDEASYKLCKTDDNQVALSCGKWHCHESCWTNASRKAIETGEIVDIECNGGLHLYTVPIKANNETIGAINFGYGNPPTDEVKLRELAEKYQVEIGKLKKMALEYETRPPYIIEMAKTRLKSTARLIGALVERKLAEDSLTENFKLLKLAGQSARFGGWSVTINDERCTWSDVVAEIHEEPHGYAPLVKDGISYYTPEWRQKITEAYTKCAQDGVPFDEEMEIITAMGNRRWVRIIGKAERDNEKRIIKVSGSFQDISERKNSEMELRKSKEFILTIIENLPIGLAVNTIEPEVNFEFMNENFAKFYGVSKEQLSSPDAFWEAVYEDAEFREAIKNKVYSDMATGDPERMKWFDIPLKKNGEIVKYITARNIPLEDKNLVISTVWDVTERKRVEESLRKSEEKLSDILNNIMDVIWSVSWPDFKPLYLSPSVERLYGRPLEEFLQNPKLFVEIIHPDDQHLMNEVFCQLEKAGEAMRECRIIRPDGSTAWIYDKSKLVYDESNKPIRVEGIAQDITGRKKTEQELIAFKNDLELKVQEKTKELKERIDELERFHEATIDREIRMKELRDEIKRLKKN